MREGLPRAVNTEHEFLAAVCGRLDTLIALIDERLPGQAATQPEPPADEPRPVALREPDAPSATEPATSTSGIHAGDDTAAAFDPEPQPAKTTTPPARTGRRTTKASK